MAEIPSIVQLFTGISDDFKNRFNITTTEDLKEVLEAIAMAQAGVAKLYYLFLADILKNVYPDTADSELSNGSLERFGRVRLNRERRPATQGEYTINVSGVDGGVIEAGAQLKSADNSLNPGELFQVVQTVTLTSTVGQVTIIALDPGRDSELQAGDELLFTATIPNVDELAIVDTVDVIPNDQETIEQYRQAILDSFRLVPQGGSASDYILWSDDVPGIRKIYPYRKPNTTGFVQVFVEAIASASTDGNGTPPQSMLDALWVVDGAGVFEFDPDTTRPINERGRRPLSAWRIEVNAIALVNVDVNVVNLKNDSQEQRDIILATVQGYLDTVRPHIDAADDPRDRNDVLFRADLATAITQALGFTNRFDDITMLVDGVELTNYLFEFGEIPLLNQINYV